MKSNEMNYFKVATIVLIIVCILLFLYLFNPTTKNVKLTDTLEISEEDIQNIIKIAGPGRVFSLCDIRTNDCITLKTRG